MENLIAHGNVFFGIWVLIGFLVVIIAGFIFYEVKKNKEIKLKEDKDGRRGSLQLPEKKE